MTNGNVRWPRITSSRWTEMLKAGFTQYQSLKTTIDPGLDIQENGWHSNGRKPKDSLLNANHQLHAVPKWLRDANEQSVWPSTSYPKSITTYRLLHESGASCGEGKQKWSYKAKVKVWKLQPKSKDLGCFILKVKNLTSPQSPISHLR